MENAFTIRFWGVRGSLATPGHAYATYGGNTSCVEVTCGSHRLILDAGTGLRALGEHHPHLDADILLSHTHIDHIQGFPFFKPLYQQGSAIRLWAGHALPEYHLRDIVGQLMQPPLFPLKLEDLKADIAFHDFRAGETLSSPVWDAAGIVIRTHALPHPDKATAYRIEYKGAAACYVTDIEHDPRYLNEALLAFIQDADVLIYDATYTDEEFPRFQGWGHSTWQEAVRLAEAANVKQCVPFHHDPDKTDSQLQALEAEAAKRSPNTLFAREGLVLTL